MSMSMEEIEWLHKHRRFYSRLKEKHGNYLLLQHSNKVFMTNSVHTCAEHEWNDSTYIDRHWSGTFRYRTEVVKKQTLAPDLWSEHTDIYFSDLSSEDFKTLQMLGKVHTSIIEADVVTSIACKI